MIVGMFFFNYFFKQRDAFARSSNMMHLVFRLYQICAICVDIFIFDQEQKFTVNLFLHSIFSIIFGLDYYNRLPYYNSTVSRDYCFCVSGYFWINIVLLITHLANLTIIDDNVIYIILIGLCFFLYIVKTFREYFYTSLIIKDIEEIDNEIHLDARFRYLLMISKNSKKDKKYELLLTSIVRVHIEKCKDSTCICKNRELLFDPKKGKFSNSELSIFKDSVFTKNYLLMLVRKSTKKLPRSSLLNIDHFLYLFEELNNIPMVNHQILMYEKQFHHSLFITVQYEIFRMRISILSLLRKKNKGFEEFQVSSLMYENIRRYDEGIEDFRSKCIDIIDNFSRMWDILNDPAPDMKMLENVCMSITDVKEETHAIYERILAVSKTSLEFLSLMKTYTKYVIFDDLLFLEVDDKIQIVKERSINDSVHLKNETFAKSLTTIEETCCSIAISINLENLGQITWNSKSCESTFGYESNYFRTFNVATILPQLIGQMHNKFLDNYFKVGKPRLLKQLSHLWAVDKNKNLFSVLMALKLYIGKEGMTALSLIKKMNDQDYLLLNARGEVFGAGSNVRNILKIPSDIEKRGLNLPISLLCPSLIPLFLEEIYDLPGFAIKLKEGPLDKDQPPQFINKEFFKSCYLFMKSDFEKDAINIADELKTALVSYRKEDHYTAVERYCSLMYKYLSMIQYEDISNISRLDICINKHCFSESLTVWEIKILGVRHVNLEKFNKSIFAKEFAFVEKYQLNALRKKAIDIIFGRNRFSDGTRRKHRESTLIDESTPIRGDHHSRERRRTNMSNSPVDIPPDLSKIRAQRQRRKTRRMSKIENNLVVPKNFVSHQKKEDADNPINSPSNSESKDPDMKESKFANSNLLKVKMRFDGVVKSHKERVGMSHEEQKLDIPIDEAAEVFYNVRDIEEQEYEFLEEPQENNSMAESSDEVNKIEGAKKQANALLVRLKAEYSQGFEMGGSVGSTASKISQRDSMIKIRNSILARRSPLGLLLARGIFVASLVLCLIINITTLRFMTSIYKEISDYSKEVWYLSKLSIGMNKVETYMSYLELVEADFFNTSLVYGVEPIAFFEKDSLRTLENTMVIFDMLMTQSNSFTGHQNTLNVYFSQEGNFSIDSRIYNFKMIDYLIMYISKVSTILSEGLPENRDLTNLKNLNSLAQMEIKAHDQISELRVDLIQRMWLIYLIDLFIRASLIIIGIMIAFPLTYRAAQGSGDVLMQLSKISQINISFYIQHYSKINIYFKSMTSMEDVLDRVSEFYETEFLLKRQRELRSGNNRIARFMKINRSGWVTWVFYGIITFTLVFITQMLRKGLFIFEYDETTKTIPRFQLIPEMANRMIIFNTISSKIMMLRASGIDQAEDISEGFKILKSCTDFMNSSIISLTDVRTDIIDAQFEAKLLTLLDSNVCEEVFCNLYRLT